MSSKYIPTTRDHRGRRLPRPDAPITTGDALRRSRLRAGLSQMEVAAATGIPRGTLASWEHSDGWGWLPRARSLVDIYGLSRPLHPMHLTGLDISAAELVSLIGEVEVSDVRA